MKKVGLFLIILLASIHCVFPQKETSPSFLVSLEEFAKNITNRMVIELKLSSEQIPQVDAVNLRFVQAQQVLFKNQEENIELIRGALKVLEEEKVNALSLVLTKKQLSQYKKILKKK